MPQTRAQSFVSTSKAAASATLHSILLGVGGIICTPHRLELLEKLGIDLPKLIEMLRGHSIMLAH